MIRNGIGVNTIDVDACNRKGIMVGNIPTYCIEEVATHAIAHILTLNRKILRYDKSVRSGVWDVKKGLPIHSVVGATLGLVGFRKIPRLVTARAKALGMKVIAYDPYVSAEDAASEGVWKVGMDALLERSDFISIHCPLTPDTRNLFDEKAFESMKDTAYLINTARGPIINETDLCQALKEGQIAGAGLDVLMDDHGGSGNPLFEFDNVVLTPHAAWYSEESMMRRRTQTVESVILVLQGQKPASWVNKAKMREARVS